MASPRITQSMRSKIVTNALDFTFKKDREALAKRENKLADQAYKDVYTDKERKAMKELGSKFVDQYDALYINVNGKRISLHFGPEVTIPKERERRFCAKNNYGYNTPSTPSQSIVDDVEQWIEDTADLQRRETQANIQLSAMLESVVSFKKLRVVWPQGEQFYDMYDVDSETKAGVPAVVVTEINKLLGL